MGSGLWLGWIAFVVYGSLLPFDFHPFAIERAIEGFRQIPFLQLGIESRADWIANGVLYVPVGLLTARLLTAAFDGRGLPLAVVLASIFGALLATAIEFTQQFFPPRTVSQNDLLAESVGTVLGALVAPLAGPWVARLLAARGFGGRHLALRALEAYAIAYLLLSLFPYDLLLSGAEWQAKIASDAWGWLLAGTKAQHGWLTGLLLGVELMLAVPIGVLVASRRGGRGIGIGAAFVLGCALGLAIEAGQMAIASGVTQGASVFTRGVGVALGARMWRLWVDRGITAFRSGLHRHAGTLGLLYVVVVLAVNGWLTHPLRDAAAVSEQWAALRLMPLYYHYYTTEAQALFSLGSVALMYLPVAVLCWARPWRPAASVAAAAGLALTIEVAKLFLDGMRPDPSNPLIAAASCWVARRVAGLIESRGADAPRADDAMRVGRAMVAASAAWPAWALTGPVLALAALSAWLLPALAWPVLGVLTVATLVVWRWPVLALALVPAALPVFDLAPWTGRFYWDEFDLLLLVVLAVGWHRTRSARAGAAPGLVLVSAVMASSLAISMLRGLTPWQWPDPNSFVSYYSGFNALRIAKGAVWAAGFIALYRRLDQPALDKHRVFAWGMCGGLLLTVAVVVWERLAFVGLFDFSADYRVTGPFSAMHTGGAYIECYLALAAAFLLWLVLGTVRPLWRWLGATLLLFTTYALMVTYSRNGYAALLAVGLVLFGAAMRGPPDSSRSSRHRLRALLVAGSMAAVVLPVLLGPFSLQRLAAVGRDQSIRWAHWQDALQMRDATWPTALFGVGLGSYPASHYWRSAEPVHAAAYGLVSEPTGPFLRLGTGAPVYVEQFVDTEPGHRYRLSLDLRSPGAARLGIALCEKWMLTSGACEGTVIDAGAAPAGWHSASVMLTTEGWAPRAWFRHRGVKLAVFNAGGAGAIDVDNLRLDTDTGANLLANGSFSAGLDRWFFSTDVDPPWHIHSLPVTILFEQGWLGVVAWSVAIALALGTAAARAWRGDPVAAPILAALLAVLVSGAVNTLIDAPRFLGLLLVLMWLGCSEDSRRVGAR